MGGAAAPRRCRRRWRGLRGDRSYGWRRRRNHSPSRKTTAHSSRRTKTLRHSQRPMAGLVWAILDVCNSISSLRSLTGTLLVDRPADSDTEPEQARPLPAVLEWSSSQPGFGGVRTITACHAPGLLALFSVFSSFARWRVRHEEIPSSVPPPGPDRNTNIPWLG